MKERFVKLRRQVAGYFKEAWERRTGTDKENGKDLYRDKAER